jgi:hypothetical protein
MHTNAYLFNQNTFHTNRALGVVWTTPLVAALGASLTIPLAMLEDMVIHGRHYSTIYILGSVQVRLFETYYQVSPNKPIHYFNPNSHV